MKEALFHSRDVKKKSLWICTGLQLLEILGNSLQPEKFKKALIAQALILGWYKGCKRKLDAKKE